MIQYTTKNFHNRYEEFTTIIVLGFVCSTLITGKLIHHYFQKKRLFFGILIIPPAILSSLMGYLFISFLEKFYNKKASQFIFEIDKLQENLVVLAFAALILGITCSRNNAQYTTCRGFTTSIIKDGLPMAIYHQTLIWGHSTTCILVLMVTNIFYNNIIPQHFASIVPLGLESDITHISFNSSNEYYFISQFLYLLNTTNSIGLIAINCFCLILINMRPFLLSNGFITIISKPLNDNTTLWNSVEDGNTQRVAKKADSAVHNLDPGDTTSFRGHKSPKEGLSIPRSFSFGDMAVSDPADAYNTQRQHYYTDSEEPVTATTTLARGPSTGYAADKMDFNKRSGVASLSMHLSLVVTAAFTSAVVMLLICWGYSGDLSPIPSAPPYLSNDLLLPLTILAGLIIMSLLINKTAIRFKRDFFVNLCGLFSDWAIAAKLAISFSTLLTQHQTGLEPKFVTPHCSRIIYFLVFLCFLWNITALHYIAPLLFGYQDVNWYQKAVSITGRALGGCGGGGIGLLWLKLMDPSLESACSTGYAAAVMLNLVLPSVQSKNTLLMMIFHRYGPAAALAISGSILAVWITVAISIGQQAIGPNPSTALLKTKHKDKAEDEIIEQQNVCIPTIDSSTDGNSAFPVTLTGINSSIINLGQAQRLVRWLPSIRRDRSWTLRYSLSRDGACLTTLLRLSCQVDRHGRPAHTSSVIVIKDSIGHIFGAYIGHALENKQTYYGTAETFLFSLHPTQGVYPATSVNNLFVLSNSHELALGGGGGFGLHLDDQMENATSAACDTFRNPQLASTEFFTCQNVEVFSLD